MRRHVRQLLVPALVIGLFPAHSSLAQTATQVIPVTGGTGLSGNLSGLVQLIVKSQTTDGSVLTRGTLNVTDLDIETRRDSSSNFLFPNSTSNNNTASTVINISPTTINVSAPTAAFSSPLTGSLSVTAGDQTANAIVGVLDAGVPGSDGAFDDPDQTGILNNATVDSFTVSTTSPLTAPVNVSGSIVASIPNNITIPNIVNTTILDVDLVVKNSSTISVIFEPVQSLSVSNLTITSNQALPLNTPLSNWVEGSHPTGAPTMLDLSTGGGDIVETTVTGTIAADIMGTILGSIDLRAELTVIGLINFGVDFNDVVNGELSDGVVSLLDISEEISLPGSEIPFAISVLHDATTNVDFDDITALIETGTLGLSLPVSLTETDVVIPLPATSFQLQNQVFNADVGLFTNGSVTIHNLQATLGGNIVVDVDADLAIGANLLASAFRANSINVVPEASSVTLLAFGTFVMGAILARRDRHRQSP